MHASKTISFLLSYNLFIPLCFVSFSQMSLMRSSDPLSSMESWPSSQFGYGGGWPMSSRFGTGSSLLPASMFGGGLSEFNRESNLMGNCDIVETPESHIFYGWWFSFRFFFFKFIRRYLQLMIRDQYGT